MTLSNYICRKTSKQQSLPTPEDFYHPGWYGFSNFRADKTRAQDIIWPRGHLPEAAVKPKTASFPPNPGLLNVMALQQLFKKKRKEKSSTTFQVSHSWEISSSQEASDFQNLHSSHRRAKKQLDKLHRAGSLPPSNPLINVPGSDSPPRSLPASSCTRRWLPSYRASPSRRRWHRPPCEEQAESRSASPESGQGLTSPPPTHLTGAFASTPLPPQLSAGLWGPSRRRSG